jgi:hypothetical protein
MSRDKNEKVWGNYGSVFSHKLNHYLRLGSPGAFIVIRDELTRDEEWYQRIDYMAKREGEWAKKIRTLLN